MHVTILGAGALGRIYGVRLAAAGARVDFIVRPGRLGETAPFRIEQVNGSRRHDALDAPARAPRVPAGTDAIVVTVRFDQLGALSEVLQGAPGAPIVVMTPLLPAQLEALRAAFGARVVPAMPGVSGYIDDRDVTRYWVVAITATLMNDPGDSAAARPALEAFARELTKAQLPTRLERDVASLNAGTTASFFPLIAAIDAGGGIDGVLGDKELLSVATAAGKECDALARRIGRVASWAGLLTKFVGPFTLKPGVAFARRVFPEAVRFVEAHFGPKLHAQHIAMGEAILAMGREHGAEMPALQKLMGLLARHRPG